MQNWMRRGAMGLAVPLVVGVPLVLLAAPAQADAPTVTLTQTANPSVYGQEVRVTAHATPPESSGENVTSGSIQFAVEGTPQGSPVHLDGNGNAVSPPLVGAGSAPLEVTTGSDFYLVTADFVPDPGSDFDSGSGPEASYQQRVDKADSTMAIQPSATSIVVDVSGALPGGTQAGSARPTGSVHVVVDGAALTPDTEVDPNTGRATVNHGLPAGEHTVSATYSGDSHYNGSSTSIVRRDPVLEARIISRFPKSRSGWYHTSVEVWFRCTSRGSALAGDCPRDVKFKKSGTNQSVTRTITALDGGTATVTVGNIDVDREKPEIVVEGASCTATDELSGVARHHCVMKFGDHGHYRAIAYDRAGNRAVEKGVLD